MELLSQLKKIYTGKDNLLNHLALFSLSGIGAICFNHRISHQLGGVYGAFMGFAPSGEYLVYVETLAGIVLFLYLTAYLFGLANELYKTNSGLVSCSLCHFTTFVKMLPIFLVWGFYMTCICTSVLFAQALSGNAYAEILIYAALIFILSPFIGVIFTIYAKELKPVKGIFSPLYIFKVFDKAFLPVILWFLQIILLAVLLFGICFGIFYAADFLNFQSNQVALRLFGLCFGTYAIQILHCIWISGLVNIVQKKILIE